MGGGNTKLEPLAVWDSTGVQETEHGVVSPVLRNVMANPRKIPTRMPNGAATVWEMVSMSFQRFAHQDAVGWRKLLRRDHELSPDGAKKFEKLSFSDKYMWVTYGYLGMNVERLATSLVAFTGLQKGDRVLIFAETQLQWMISMLACFRQGAAIVTAYATLGEEGVRTSLNESGAKTCICDEKLFSVLAKASKSCPGLKYVVPITIPVDQGPDQQWEELPGIQIKSYAELMKMSTPIVQPSPPEPNDLAVLMYTSGTTSKSKGVMLAHENIVAQAAATLSIMPFVDRSTVYIAYLPMAHIMELFIQCALLSSGAKVGYGSPHTLLDPPSGQKLAAGQRGDAPLLKPTLMVFAPAVLDKVYAGVKANVEKMRAEGSVKAKAFDCALAAGYKNYDRGVVGCGIYSPAMLAVQRRVGGKVKYMITGSAPLSPEIQKFVQSCFCCPVRQGYGLTETCAASAVASMGDNTPAQVGPPTPSTCIRLRDWPEGGYLNSDLERSDIRMRRGEVLLGGPTVARGYLAEQSFRDPEATDDNGDALRELEKKNKEDFITIDGMRYFCTGDIGQVTDRGCLMIIDRKKDLFKGENGEYVSLSKVEACVQLSEYVEKPMVYGKTGAKSVIALVCPKKAKVLEFAQKAGISEDFMQLCKNKDVVTEISRSILRKCRDGGLVAFEIPSAISLCVDPQGDLAWTPENDLLTSTQKLKRPMIAKAFASEIEDAYLRSSK